MVGKLGFENINAASHLWLKYKYVSYFIRIFLKHVITRSIS